MHTLSIVPYYAAVLAVLFIGLSVRVIAMRRSANVGFGAAGSADLERRVRVHANFTEYAPFGLLLMTMAEMRGASAWAVHLGCSMLLGGRLVHAFGVSRPQTDEIGRIGGMAGSLSAILWGAALCVVAG